MSTQDGVDWSAVSAARASKRRKQTIRTLQEEPQFASEIADDLDTTRGTVSKHLHWLKRNDLAECLTPDRPHHRIYGLTDEGEAVAEKV